LCNPLKTLNQKEVKDVKGVARLVLEICISSRYEWEGEEDILHTLHILLAICFHVHSAVDIEARRPSSYHPRSAGPKEVAKAEERQAGDTPRICTDQKCSAVIF
jgi:hypothetical protein